MRKPISVTIAFTNCTFYPMISLLYHAGNGRLLSPPLMNGWKTKRKSKKRLNRNHAGAGGKRNADSPGLTAFKVVNLYGNY